MLEYRIKSRITRLNGTLFLHMSKIKRRTCLKEMSAHIYAYANHCVNQFNISIPVNSARRSTGEKRAASTLIICIHNLNKSTVFKLICQQLHSEIESEIVNEIYLTIFKNNYKCFFVFLLQIITFLFKRSLHPYLANFFCCPCRT